MLPRHPRAKRFIGTLLINPLKLFFKRNFKVFFLLFFPFFLFSSSSFFFFHFQILEPCRGRKKKVKGKPDSFRDRRFRIDRLDNSPKAKSLLKRKKKRRERKVTDRRYKYSKALR